MRDSKLVTNNSTHAHPPCFPPTLVRLKEEGQQESSHLYHVGMKYEDIILATLLCYLYMVEKRLMPPILSGRKPPLRDLNSRPFLYGETYHCWTRCISHLTTHQSSAPLNHRISCNQIHYPLRVTLQININLAREWQPIIVRAAPHPPITTHITTV